ncbi:MAG: hypothetical protein H7Y43_03595 [Akkermansiaceae bacterium]|nr:hypothetical protein [Verrucomicrobiales bacterium]
MKEATIGLALRDGDSRRVAALLCLALFLVLQVFSASDLLHQCLHTDSATPGHSCVITLLGQGQVEVPPAAVACVVVMLGFLFLLPWLSSAHFHSFQFRLAPSRGPPRA